MNHCLAILVQTPAHSQIAGALSYRSELALPAGTLVRVPLGKREMLGLVWDAPDSGSDQAPITPEKLRSLVGPLEGLAPVSPAWRQLVTFAAGYYQRSVGEVALAALPPQLRELSTVQLTRRLKRHAKAGAPNAANGVSDEGLTVLTPEQALALARFEAESGPFLLFGATGSGKTEL